MSSKNAPDPPRRAWSLAARLTAWYAGSAFLLVLVATGYLYWALVSSLNEEDDATLARKANVLRAVLRDRPDDVAALRQETEAHGEEGSSPKVRVRVLNEAGETVVETPGMRNALPPYSFPPPRQTGQEPGAGTNLRTALGEPFRVLAVQASQGDVQEIYLVQVALHRQQEEELMADYRRNLWLVLGVALIACTAAGYGIARRGLRPIEQVTAMARRIRPATLDVRVETAGLPAEVLELAYTFNAMLERLEESFGRLARFSSDIAHELRTPVNNLRGEIEVLLNRPRSPEEYGEALGSSLEECARLSRIIDSLLFLARAENPRTQIERERIGLVKELTAMREFYEPALAEAGVRMSVAGDGEVFAELNRPLFQRAVGNLVENALAHVKAGGLLTLTVACQDNQVRIEVADTGSGIPEEHLQHVFDRFYRVDRARSSTSGGVGLGLAIVKSIAELHGGSVSIDSIAGHGTRVILRFPVPADRKGQPAV